jgi:hypothetical protein
MALKDVVMSLLFFIQSNFTKSFIVECDASKKGTIRVLMQNGRPIAYFSKDLKGKKLNSLTYKKELCAIVMTVQM